MQDCGHTPEWTGPTVERVMRNGKRIFASPFKAWLVEQACKPGASVAGLAMHHGVNANQLRHWMRLQHWHEAPSAPAAVMLPVTIAQLAEPAPTTAGSQPPAAIEIEIGGAVVRVRDRVDPDRLRLVLEALRA